MKKRISALLLISLIVSMLAGCGQKDAAYLKDIKKVDKYVTLGQYKGLEATAKKTEITDEYMDRYIEYILSMYTEYEEVTGRPVQVGDTVDIDFDGYMDGELFEGGSSTGYNLEIGSNSFISGFEDGLIGANVGDKVTLDLNFPDPYTNNPDLSGAPVTFEVKINKIQETVIPDLSDEIVASFGIEGVTTADEFRTLLREEFEADAEATYKQMVKEQLVAAVTENATVTVPDKMSDRHYDMLINRLKKEAEAQNLELKDYLLMYYGLSSDKYEDTIRENALESAKQMLVLKAVAQAENIQITKKDIEDNMAYDAEQTGITVEAYKADLDQDAYEEYVMSVKVLDYLMEQAVVSEPAADTED